MKRGWLYAVAALLFATTLTSAQQPGIDSSEVLGFENGAVANSIYTNECFGFSLRISAGWELASQVVGAAGLRARHVPHDVLVLFAIEQHEERGSSSRIVVTAQGAKDQTETAQDFVANAVRLQIKVSPQNNVMIRDTYAVEYGGKHFFRSDYKHSWNNRDTSYMAFVYTKFRGYFIGVNLIAGSREGLDEAANSLQGISFQEDQVNSKCVMLSSGIDLPDRVRVSQGVSTGLLVTKVPPQYPDDAKQARIQGQVVLTAVIDKNGDVENLTLVSGHPLLAPAAIEAVKQWKYKPYLLNGQPVAVETQVTVSFQLSGQ
ncbi:MAG: energy transducer TonB [Terriglobales bacterium]|jgi:TonB family protein